MPESAEEILARALEDVGSRLVQASNELRSFKAQSELGEGVKAVAASTTALTKHVARQDVPKEQIVRMLVAKVADTHNVPVSDIYGRSRKISVVTARQRAMYLIRTATDLSYPEIGSIFDGRDHTTVIHAMHRIEKSIAINTDLQDWLLELTHHAMDMTEEEFLAAELPDVPGKAISSRKEQFLYEVGNAIGVLDGIGMAELRGPRRSHMVTQARQSAMYVAYQASLYNRTEIARYFGYNGAEAVRLAVARVEARLANEPAYAKRLRQACQKHGWSLNRRHSPHPPLH